MHSNNTPLTQHLLHNIVTLYTELESAQILDEQNEKLLREQSTVFFAIVNKLLDTVKSDNNLTSREYINSMRDRFHDIDKLELSNEQLIKNKKRKQLPTGEWVYDTVTLPDVERIEIKRTMIQHWRSIVYRIQWFREKITDFM